MELDEFKKGVEDILSKLDLQPIKPPTIIGRSGVAHSFYAATRDGSGKLVVIDVADEDGKQILTLQAKTIDTEAAAKILISNRKVSEDVKKLAEQYKITLIEAEGAEEALKKLGEAVKLL